MHKILLLGVCGVLWGEHVPGQESPPKPPLRIDLNDPLPYGQRPIDYFSPATQNAVEQLQQRLQREKTLLAADPQQGYLPSLLKELDISPTSQILVFSKTALNPKLVSPKTPRALYFNEDTYVGWVPGAAALEVATVDPVKGWMFYTLTQPAYSSEEQKQRTPTLERQTQCLACHAGQSTLRVPGGLVRGFVPDEKGNPLSGYSRITHETPLAKRFGGWYVTGEHGQQTHRGNLIESKTGPATQLMNNPNNRKNLSGLFEASSYLSAHSDIVAQLLLHHQIHGQNLLIRVGYEARLGKHSDAEEQLIRYLLFADEAPLSEPIQGSTRFSQWFEKRGKPDSQGRSLRQWDLQTRLFRYRLSYLIESQLFESLPAKTKQRIYRKFWELLSAPNPPEPYHQIPPEERRAILEIVAHLKKDLPAQWKPIRIQPAKRDG